MSSWSRPEWIGDIERKAALDRFLEREGDDLDAKRANDARRRANGETIRKAAATGIKASDLKAMEFPPIKYVVRGYIVEGLTILAGRPKLGKSWLCYDIANGVAGGRFVLGDIECQEGDVLYLALEDNPRRLQGRMRKLMPFADWPERLTFHTEWPRLDAGGIDRIRQWIEGAESPRLVVIDTLAKVRGARSKEESTYDGDYRALGDLQKLAGQKGVAIVLVHHVRKMDADDPLDTVSGTTGLTGAADTVLVLNRTSQGVTLVGRGRDIEEIDVAVSFSKESCRWTAQGPAAEVRRSGERGAILDALQACGEPMTPTEISGAAGMPCNNVRQLLFKMMKAGEVEKSGRGRYACSETLNNTDNEITGEENEDTEQPLSEAVNVIASADSDNNDTDDRPRCAYCGFAAMGSFDPVMEVHHGDNVHWLHRDCVDPWQESGWQPAPETLRSMCIHCGKSFPKDDDHHCEPQRRQR